MAFFSFFFGAIYEWAGTTLLVFSKLLGAKAPLILAHVKKNSRTKKFKIAYLHIWCYLTCNFFVNTYLHMVKYSQILLDIV